MKQEDGSSDVNNGQKEKIMDFEFNIISMKLAVLVYTFNASSREAEGSGSR